MADGQVLIDTKIDTGGVERGIEDIQRDFSKMSKAVDKVLKNIESGFRDIALGQLPVSFQEAYSKIETIRANDTLDAVQQAQKIAKVYEELGDDQVSAAKKAWSIIESESEQGSRKVIDDLQEIAKNAQKSGEKMADAIKSSGLEKILSGEFWANLGANLLSNAISNAADAVWDFARESVKSAVQYSADVAAANAQFEQAFKDLENTARSTLESIADSTGISATRMQDAYTSIFAFTKSVGADSEQALNISARAMVVAADSAAYYDRSIEDVTETLQSFLKGNYENDAALGIAATETTRNTKANEKYAKSFNDLTEAQKVDVLLSMVEAGNEASGAMGQAAREADSWTNVTGELEEAWRQLLAQLGTPALQKLIPVLQTVTGKMQEFTNLASRELKLSLDTIDYSMENAQNRFKETSEEIEHAALMAEQYLKRLQELEEQNVWTTETQQEYATIVGLLDGLLAGMNLEIDEQTGLLLTNKDAILSEIEAMKERAKAAAQEELLTEIYRNQLEAEQALKEAEDELCRLQADRSTILKQTESITSELSTTEQEYAKNLFDTLDILAESGQSYEGIIPLIDQYGQGLLRTNKELDDLARAYYNNAVEQKKVTGEIEHANEIIKKCDDQVASLAGTVEDTAETGERRFGAMTGAMEEDVETIIGAFNRMSESVNASMESIKDKTVYIDIYERYHSYGGSFTPNQGGGNSGAPTAYTADSVAPAYVPYLATGAVIPPRAPFYAVLGDQSNGRNLEAPEGLIRQIVREEAGGEIEVHNHIEIDGDLAPLIRLMYPAFKAEAKRKGKSLAVEMSNNPDY